MYQLAFDEEADHLAAERLNRSGVALAESGQLEEAVAAFHAALTHNASAWTAHNNLGILLARLRRFDQAAESFRRAIERHPASAQARNNLGNALAEMGRHEEAVASFEQALRLEPDYPDARYNLGKVLLLMGRPARAAACFEEVLSAQPDRAAAQRQLGRALSAQGNHQAAIAALRQAVDLDSEEAENHYQLGCALREVGRLSEAIMCLERAVRLRPDYFDALSALGVALTSAGQAERACDYFCQAAERCGETPALWCNWGIALAARGRHEEAMALYAKALEANPGHAEVCNNRATALAGLHRDEEALAGYHRAIALKPEYADAYRNRGIVYLLLGDFARGWNDFEWRWNCRDFRAPSCARPLWDSAPLEGRTILLRAEQGLGDTLQFIRYAPLVKARGGRVVVRVPRALENLLARAPGIDHLVTNDAFNDFDVHLPLMSLPKVFGTTLETIPATVPYLFADEKLVCHWRERLRPLPLPESPFLVGIAWQGNPRYPADAQRSVPLEFFEPLTKVPGVRLVSLQQGHGAEQLLNVAGRFLVSELPGAVDRAHGRFMDTAAIMTVLDLIVTSDTAVAHLAGGLGLKVWMATPHVPDWRWLLARDDSPWYPTLRLFRQPSPGDWASVFAQIAGELQKQVAPAAPFQTPDKPAQGITCGGRSDQRRGTGPARRKRARPRRPASVSDAIAEPLLRQAITLASSGKLRDALEELNKVLWHEPRRLEAHYHRGTILDGLGQFAQAAAAFRRCLRLAPRNSAARVSLGVSLANLGLFEQAEQELRDALRLDDTAAESHYSLGNVLASRGQWEPALDCFRRALEINPALAAAYAASANVLRQQGRFHEALAEYDRALERQPVLRQARTMRAETSLLLGDFERGWSELAAQHAEGVYGTGMAPRRTGAALEWACNRLLVTAGRELGEPSLLLRFAEPAMTPLEVSKSLVERWKQELATLAGYKVGIQWRSDERDGGVPRKWIDSLARIPGVQLVQLPTAWRESPIPSRGGGLQYMTDGAVIPRVASATELAAVIANLDLVIATDGTAAHLAGALAVPFYVPLSVVPHWCWFLDRTDSPWYPSATLFRQSRRGDWTEVCAAIEQRLHQAVRGEKVPVPGEAEAERLCAQAAHLAEQGKLSEALDCCQRATAAAPGSSEAYNNLGAAYTRLGHYREAAAACRLALRRMPFYPEALLNLGTALANSGETEDAVRVFHQAVRQRPQWARAHFYLGNALASLARWRAARDRYRVAATLDPDEGEIQLNLGAAYRETGELEESAATLENALHLRPGHVPTLNHLAVTFCRQRL